MSDIALPGSIEPAARKGPDLGGGINPLTGILFGGGVAAVVLFVAYSIYSDIGNTDAKVTSYAPFLLLFVALLIALGLEFVNGFHDTANAEATVIYTRSPPCQSKGLLRAARRLCHGRATDRNAARACEGLRRTVEIPALDRYPLRFAAHRDGKDPAVQAKELES